MRPQSTKLQERHFRHLNGCFSAGKGPLKCTVCNLKPQNYYSNHLNSKCHVSNQSGQKPESQAEYTRSKMNYLSVIVNKGKYLNYLCSLISNHGTIYLSLKKKKKPVRLNSKHFFCCLGQAIPFALPMVSLYYLLNYFNNNLNM